MTQRKNKAYLFAVNLIRIVISINIVALGVAFLLKAGLGTDPLTVLQDGLHAKLFITVGEAVLIYNSSILLLAVLFAPNYLGWGTVIYSFSIGFFIDRYIDLLKAVRLNGIYCFFVGLLIMCIGSSFIISLDLGQNGLDALLLTLRDKKGMRYAANRTISDTVYTLGGWLMGGKVGLGTLLAILLSGCLIGFFNSLIFKIKTGINGKIQLEKRD